MSYLSQGSDAQRVQLAVQELIVNLADSSIVTASASTVTVDFQENINYIKGVIFIQDGTTNPITISVANQTVNPGGSSPTQVKLTLPAPMATNDVLRVCAVLIS